MASLAKSLRTMSRRELEALRVVAAERPTRTLAEACDLAKMQLRIEKELLRRMVDCVNV